MSLKYAYNSRWARNNCIVYLILFPSLLKSHHIYCLYSGKCVTYCPLAFVTFHACHIKFETHKILTINLLTWLEIWHNDKRTTPATNRSTFLEGENVLLPSRVNISLRVWNLCIYLPFNSPSACSSSGKWAEHTRSEKNISNLSKMTKTEEAKNGQFFKCLPSIWCFTFSAYDTSVLWSPALPVVVDMYGELKWQRWRQWGWENDEDFKWLPYAKWNGRRVAPSRVSVSQIQSGRTTGYKCIQKEKWIPKKKLT